jgi:FAM192A/Fyv6, N-terminal domain
MSLSFVTKAIQTTAADGTFEETVVENAEDRTAGSRRHNEHAVGLFDQLRQNQEEAEAARLEFQRSIMRGTLALDEDDVAHLQQLHQQKDVEQMTQLQQTESQLASFRAAQAERQERAALTEPSARSAFDAQVLEDSTKETFVPAINIRKRKRKVQDPVAFQEKSLDNENAGSEVANANDKFSSSNNPPNALSSLLSGYSSEESA